MNAGNSIRNQYESQLKQAGNLNPDPGFAYKEDAHTKEHQKQQIPEFFRDRIIPEERIVSEEASKNTIENILNSKKLLPEQESYSDLHIGIVTNNFHVYRGMALAKRQGLTSIYGVSAPSNLTYLPNNMLREFVGIMKDSLFGNMNFFAG